MSAPDLVLPGTTGGGAPVGGSGTIGTVPKWDTTTTLNNSVITQSGSNVGIGVAIPGAVLDVLGTSADTDFRVSRTGGSPYFAISAPGGADTLSQFFVSGVSVMGLTTGGRVGIGTGATSPSAALDLPASTGARASLRIQAGSTPTAPNNGDIWFDGTNIFMRVGGVTRTFTLV